MTTDWKISRRRFIKYGLLAGVGLVCGKGVINTTGLEIESTRTDIAIRDLPAKFRGMRIAFMADFHASPIVTRGLLRKSAGLAMEAKPDLIVLGGDYVSGVFEAYTDTSFPLNEKYLDKFIDSMSGISAPLGIYAVPGNHDFWYGKPGIDKMMSEMKRALGVQWLRNQHVKLSRGGQEIALLGVDDYWENTCSPHDACKGLGKDIVKVLVSHNPDINASIDAFNLDIDLILAGHTHGGQIRLPLVGAPITTSNYGQKYMAGLVRDGSRQTYITRGVGHLTVPIRYNCPPEVSILTLV